MLQSAVGALRGKAASKALAECETLRGEVGRRYLHFAYEALTARNNARNNGSSAR